MHFKVSLKLEVYRDEDLESERGVTACPPKHAMPLKIWKRLGYVCEIRRFRTGDVYQEVIGLISRLLYKSAFRIGRIP